MAITKHFLASLALSTTALAAAMPAQALTTSPVPITNLPRAITTSSSTNLNFAGFNQTNFSSIWSAAPFGTVPVLSDVRLYMQGVLSGNFSIVNDNSNSSVTVNSPTLNFDLRSNNLVNNNTTTNQTGSVAAAVSKTFFTSPTTPPGPPGPPPTSNTTNPSSVRYCPGNNWVAGTYDPSDEVQPWTCLTTQSGSFNINPTNAPTSTNWSLIGGGNTYDAANSFWSGTTVSVPTTVALNFSGLTPSTSTGTFTLSSLPANTYLVYTYNYLNTSVPSPLPLVGAGFAFGFSRRLRRRIGSSVSQA